MLNKLIDFGTNHGDKIEIGLMVAFSAIVLSGIVMFIKDSK